MFLHESTESIVAQSSHLQPSHESDEEATPIPAAAAAAASPTVLQQQEQHHHVFDVNGKTLTPLSGREVEHAAIQQFLTAHLAMDNNTHNTHNSSVCNANGGGGCGRVLFLCGPCGVGKSTTVARILPPHQSTSSSTEAARTLSSGGGGGVTIDCRIQVPMERLFNPSSPSSAPTSATAAALTRTVERQIRPIHINCTDLSASSLIDEVVAKMRYRQRKQSEVLAAKETLLRSTSIHKEEKFAESLDKLLVKLNYPYHLSSSSLKFTACDAADAQRFPSATTTRGSTGGRSSTSSTTSSSSSSSDAAGGTTTRRAETALAALWKSVPLHVLVLDEADSSRSSAVLRNLFYLVKRCPFWFSMICIANSRWLNYFPADDQHASAHVQVVTFDAYNADVLRKIGEIAAAEVHQERRAKRHRENESSTTAEDDGKDDGAGAMLLAPAAAAFAAKTAVLNFGGDARKVKELVRRAADHHTNTTTSSITATRTVVAVAPPETSAAAKPVRGRPSKKLRDEVSNPSTTTNTATSCSVSTTLSLKDVMTAATSTSRVPASSVVERLPEHATYVLCCIVVMARRNALAAHMHRSSAVAPGLSEQQQQQRAIDSTSTVVFGASGEMRRLDVERCYKRLMAELRLPQCNQGVVTFALELLQLNGLISDTKTFVCSGEWTLAELETALVAKGTELLSDQDPGTSSQATNKFAEVFYRQRVLF